MPQPPADTATATPGTAPQALAAQGSTVAEGPGLENLHVAEMLREMAVLLETQQGNRYRVAAYRQAADMLTSLSPNVRDLFEHGGLPALDALPTVGPGIAAAIGEILTSGRWRKLDRLRGEIDGGAVFRSIPGVGALLARRLHDELGVDTLEALEAAAHDGRLERLPRLGARRAAGLRSALTELLDRTRALRRARTQRLAATEPPVEWLLDVDREYRSAVAAGSLPKIAPRRFNPEGAAWLPVLHTRRGDWQFTALYSNTARAHELDRAHDWVVLYGEDAQHAERQYTVVTAPRGSLAGRRVVRGREALCQAWYSQT